MNINMQQHLPAYIFAGVQWHLGLTPNLEGHAIYRLKDAIVTEEYNIHHVNHVHI